jgi:hypothetical protein
MSFDVQAWQRPGGKKNDEDDVMMRFNTSSSSPHSVVFGACRPIDIEQCSSPHVVGGTPDDSAYLMFQGDVCCTLLRL